MQRKLFDGLKSTFEKLFNSFAGNLQNELKHIANNVRFNDIRSIPVEETSGAITCKGLLWGHNTNEMSYQQVNTYALSEQISQSIEEYSTAWNNEWSKLFSNNRKELEEKLGSAISDFEKQVMSSSFNDSYYRGLIDSNLDKLREHRELSIGDLISNFQRQGDDIANRQFEPSETEELEEVKVKTYLDKKLREHNLGLISDFRILSDSIKQDVKNQINKNLQETLSIIEKMKNSFADNLKSEGEAYLTSLENDMEDKTVVLKKVERIITCVSELATLYK